MLKKYILLVIGCFNMSGVSAQDSWFFDKRVLVTGGAGFIGSHIVDALVHAGARVRVLDNLSNGNTQNLEHVWRCIEFMRADITDPAACQMAARGCVVIFHLAAQISVAESMANPKQCYETNIRGLYNILEAARLEHVQRVVFSSSAAVYGAAGGVCVETMSCAPLSPYGYSKMIGEQLCQSYARIYGLQTMCLRYFNVYGERQNPHSPYAGVRAIFVAAMRANKPLVVYGDGEQTRDFVSVADVVRANLTCAQLPMQEMTGQPVNVASGKQVSLNQLLVQLRREFPDFRARIFYQPARAGDIHHSSANIERYRTLAQMVKQ